LGRERETEVHEDWDIQTVWDGRWGKCPMKIKNDGKRELRCEKTRARVYWRLWYLYISKHWGGEFYMNELSNIVQPRVPGSLIVKDMLGGISFPWTRGGASVAKSPLGGDRGARWCLSNYVGYDVKYS
jgi:hypothetical protein